MTVSHQIIQFCRMKQTTVAYLYILYIHSVYISSSFNVHVGVIFSHVYYGCAIRTVTTTFTTHACAFQFMLSTATSVCGAVPFTLTPYQL